MTLPALGRDYLAYPDTAGAVVFSICWNAARVPLVEGWIKELGALYPRISVENEVTDCPPLQQKQVAQSAAGTPPNVLMVKSDNTAFYAEQQLLRPIDDLMRRDGVKADWFYPGEFRSRTWQGKAYGLPNDTAGSLHLLFVNTRLLQRVGWDPQKPVGKWQDLEALVEPARREGLFVMDPAKVSTGQTMHFVLTYANGGRYWDDDLTRITWNQAPAVEAAEWLVRFIKTQAGQYERLAVAADRKNANPFWPAVTSDLAEGISVPTSTVHPQLVQLWYEMEDALILERMGPRDALNSNAARGQALLDEWNARRKK